MTLQDSGTLTPEGYHDKNSVSMWARGGRKLLNPTSYISYVEGLKPDIFQMLCDGDTNVDSSTKRVKKSVDSTLKFATLCASLKEKSEVDNIIQYNIHLTYQCHNFSGVETNSSIC